MTASIGAVETVINGVSAIRRIAEDLRRVIGDHELVGQLHQIASDVETAVNELSTAAQDVPTTVERVAESVWEKITAGFGDLFGPHKADIQQTVKQGAQTVAVAVNDHTATVADAVSQAVSGGMPIATGPQPPGGAGPVGSAATAGAPARTQGGNAGAPASNTTPAADAKGQTDLPVTGQTIGTDGQVVDVVDGGKSGASSAIVIS